MMQKVQIENWNFDGEDGRVHPGFAANARSTVDLKDRWKNIARMLENDAFARYPYLEVWTRVAWLTRLTRALRANRVTFARRTRPNFARARAGSAAVCASPRRACLLETSPRRACRLQLRVGVDGRLLCSARAYKIQLTSPHRMPSPVQRTPSGRTAWRTFRPSATLTTESGP